MTISKHFYLLTIPVAIFPSPDFFMFSLTKQKSFSVFSLYSFSFLCRQLLTEHRQTLIVELSSESDPAAALHLASMILFQTFTNSFVHAPGRCVPKIIDFLAEHMSPLSHEVLRIFQG